MLHISLIWNVSALAAHWCAGKSRTSPWWLYNLAGILYVHTDHASSSTLYSSTSSVESSQLPPNSKNLLLWLTRVPYMCTRAGCFMVIHTSIIGSYHAKILSVPPATYSLSLVDDMLTPGQEPSTGSDALLLQILFVISKCRNSLVSSASNT